MNVNEQGEATLKAQCVKGRESQTLTLRLPIHCLDNLVNVSVRPAEMPCTE